MDINSGVSTDVNSATEVPSAFCEAPVQPHDSDLYGPLADTILESSLHRPGNPPPAAGEQQAEPEDVCENARCQKKRPAYENRQPIDQRLTGELAGLKLFLDRLKSLQALTSGQRGAQDAGGDDQAYGGQRPNPGTDLKQKDQFQKWNAHEKKDQSTHRSASPFEGPRGKMDSEAVLPSPPAPGPKGFRRR